MSRHVFARFRIRIALLAALLALSPAVVTDAFGSVTEDAPKKDEGQAEKKPDAAKKKGPAPAPAPSPYAAAARASQRRTAGEVITTEDLERLFSGANAIGTFNAPVGAPPDSRNPEEAPEASLPLPPPGEDPAARRARTAADLEAKRASVQRLEKQLLALKNPFAARPDVSDEEKEARANDVSVAATIARVRQELDVAREALSLAERGSAAAPPSEAGAGSEKRD